MKEIRGLTTERFLLPGHTACPGCGAAIGLKIALKVLGERTIIVIPACCSSVIQGVYPKVALNIPTIEFITFKTVSSSFTGSLIEV